VLYLVRKGALNPGNKTWLQTLSASNPYTH
jgi:hypothetical protein